MTKTPIEHFAIPNLAELQGGDNQDGSSVAESDSVVQGVLARNHDRLMQSDGVVMVGEGEDEIGRPAIVVGVKSRHHLSALPKEIDGVRVVGWVVGEVDALGNTRRK
jgi:hypothetical protein